VSTVEAQYMPVWDYTSNNTITQVSTMMPVTMQVTRIASYLSIAPEDETGLTLTLYRNGLPTSATWNINGSLQNATWVPSTGALGYISYVAGETLAMGIQGQINDGDNAPTVSFVIYYRIVDEF
jgi:hypothetical protein